MIRYLALLLVACGAAAEPEPVAPRPPPEPPRAPAYDPPPPSHGTMVVEAPVVDDVTPCSRARNELGVRESIVADTLRKREAWSAEHCQKTTHNQVTMNRRQVFVQTQPAGDGGWYVCDGKITNSPGSHIEPLVDAQRDAARNAMERACSQR